MFGGGQFCAILLLDLNYDFLGFWLKNNLSLGFQNHVAENIFWISAGWSKVFCGIWTRPRDNFRFSG